MDAVILVILILISISDVSSSSLVGGGEGAAFRSHALPVQRKFKGVSTEHDRRRHLASAVDLPLGGDGKVMGTELYYTKLKIGSALQDYYVCFDTGSNLFWIKCDQKNLYYPSKSETSIILPCGHAMCQRTCKSNSPCEFQMSYGDGSSSTGYLVTDQVQLDAVSGNFSTKPVNTNVFFGCGVHQYGLFAAAGAGHDGIVGFGRSNMSLISQLADSGIVKKSFSHCLDADNGGGIFILGQVEHPKVNTTLLIKNSTHYSVNMLSIEIGKYILQMDTRNRMETIIDSGTTLAYLPEETYQIFLNKILSEHPHLELFMLRDVLCFHYNGSADVVFPSVTLNFDGSLKFVVHPHEYLIHYELYTYCLGWKSSRSLAKWAHDFAILGDVIISNKFVTYDLENETVGWKEYDCFSSAGVKDENSSAVSEVDPHLIWAPPSDNSAVAGIDIGVVVVSLILLSSFLTCQIQIELHDNGILCNRISADLHTANAPVKNVEIRLKPLEKEGCDLTDLLNGPGQETAESMQSIDGEESLMARRL